MTSSNPRWTGPEPTVRAKTDDLVSAYPTHVPMGLPLPAQTPDRPDEEYTL